MVKIASFMLHVFYNNTKKKKMGGTAESGSSLKKGHEQVFPVREESK